MSSKQNESVDSIEIQKKTALKIAEILREDYQDSGSAIKWIARYTGASEHAVRNWYDAAREPSLDNFIALTKASPSLIEWFLDQVGREDLAHLIQKQNQAEKPHLMTDDFDLIRLIFETKDPSQILKKMQKLTLRQLWFYAQIKGGRQLCVKDLIYIFGVSRATAYRDIDELVKLDLLCRVGQGQNEYYAALQ